ncbi:MAG: membrane protein insertase YidC [Bacteroidetes bacterium]|nr:membrane protein insertase YidC [Bacteroidota bacterium]
MDKNSVIGLFLIGILIIGYSVYTQPSEQERLATQHTADSIAAIKKITEKDQATQQKNISASVKEVADSAQTDSARKEIALQEFGSFSEAAAGKEEFFTVENDLMKILISSKGALIKSVELKKYKTHDGKPVRLMSGDSSTFNLSFPAQNRSINSTDLYFSSQGIVGKGAAKVISFRLTAGAGKYIDYNYSLMDGSYLVGFHIDLVNLNDVIAPNATYLAFDWRENVIQQEKSITNERAATTIYYHFMDDEVDKINPAKSEEQSLKTKVKWVAFKQQFFTSVLIADNAFDSPVVETKKDEGQTKYVKSLSASFALPYDHKAAESYGMKFYFGPNHYQTLKKIDNLGLEKQIALGWGIFGYVNKFIVIPIFNFLNGFHLNFGLIILILTIIIRIIILPLTFGSFKSQAKIKILAPEIKEINDKFGDDAMKKQQETMALYKKAGVNPLGGCIPGLLQLPILIAMFNFFPTSIELRQESFLWAHDLSTYDSVLDLGFKIPFYGDHVSLFTLLMTISTLLFTKLNMQMTSASNPQMKWMMYIMPIMFLGVFNNYSAGLSYYYFLSNIFGLGQQYLFKYFIDEEAIHRQMQENKKKTVKKSGFQQRLEQMAKERGYQAKKK